MFEKRLFSLVPQATPYIMASVLFKWIALMANITVMWVLARILGGIVTDGLSAALAVDALAQAALPLAAAIIVRAASIYLAQRAGDKAAFEAVRRVRSFVYDKLTALGPSYTETVPTAEAVQTSVEGATQLQVYFGGYLPQLFFAGLAPITLFVLLVGQAGLPAALLLACVPVIPVSIMMVMRNAKKIGAEYWGSYVDLGGMFLEAVQGLTTLKVYQADRSWHERINAESERFRTATMHLLVMQLRSICVMDLVVYMGAALGIIVAALQLATGKIGFEAAFLIVFLSQEFFLPMRRLGSLFHTAMNGMAASRRMFGILDTPEPERGDVELDGRGDIELAGVSYAYGDRTVLDEKLQQLMNKLEGESSVKTGMTLNVAINYGGRPEIVRAAQQLAEKAAAGQLKPEEITEQMLSDAMYTAGQKDPDFILRPSGEKRLSNFMLWQAAYAELVEMDVLWPDFTRADLDAAIEEYNHRSRRFGGL